MEPSATPTESPWTFTEPSATSMKASGGGGTARATGGTPPPDAFRDVHGGSMDDTEGAMDVHDASVDDAEGARHPHNGIPRAAHG